jgi:hypothetical protein
MERQEDLLLLGFQRKKSIALCRAPKEIQALCRNRATKRWSTLLTQNKSRIGYKCGMRKRLGEIHWAAFVKYAKAKHKEAFCRALTPASGVLRCEGSIEGTPCPKGFCIGLKSLSVDECGNELPGLHMDHTHDIKHVCRIWSQALHEHPQSSDDGVCGPLVAHLLFGVEDHVIAQCSDRPIWRKQVVPRCGDKRSVEGQRADDFCHDIACAHYECTLRVKDIRWPITE